MQTLGPNHTPNIVLGNAGKQGTAQLLTNIQLQGITEKHYGKQSNFPWALASTKFQLQRSCTLDGGPPRSPVKHCSTVDVGNRWKIHGRSLPLHLMKGSQAFSKDLWRINTKKTMSDQGKYRMSNQLHAKLQHNCKPLNVELKNNRITAPTSCYFI